MAIKVGSTQHLNTSGQLQNISSLDSTTETTISSAVSSNISSGNITISGGGSLVGYSGQLCSLQANTSYLFYAPNTTTQGVYIYQNSNPNDRLVNGMNGATAYVYANGSTARTNVGMGGVSGGNPGPYLIFEL